MNYNKLPADPSAMVMGIVSVLLVIMGFCCGLFPLVSIVLGIIGLVTANKSLRMYDAEPESYSHVSRKNVYTGKILSVVALVLNALALIAVIVGLLFLKQGIDNGYFEKLRKDLHIEQTQRDSLDNESVTYQYNTDSLSVESTDSITVEQPKEN